MTAHTKLSAKGQVVIPKDVRERLGWGVGTVFEVIEREGEILLRRSGAARHEAKSAAEALREIQSFYRYEGPPLSLDDLRDAAQKQAIEQFIDRSRG